MLPGSPWLEALIPFYSHDTVSETTISSEQAGKTCPYCRFPLKAGTKAVVCDACGTIHHEECWRDGGGCAVLGCVNVGGGGGPLANAGTAPGQQTAPPVLRESVARPSAIRRNLFIGIASG